MKSGFVFSLVLGMLLLPVVDAAGQSRSKKRQLRLGSAVPSQQQVSMDAIDHRNWHALLQKYVDQNGDVNYAALKASANDSAVLDGYIASLSAASQQQAAKRSSQKAFWINAYNAVTVKGILQEYPTTSIRNHTSKLGGYNLWKDLLLNVGGTDVSLDSMEHKKLRPMGDARIHFAIVCASKGCPRLMNQAYFSETLNNQLDTNALHFFAQPQNFQYDANSRVFKMSEIMQWFGTDFGSDQAAQLRAISPYLPTQQAQQAANANSVRVSYLNYSWDLNEQQASGSGSTAKPGSGSKLGSQKK